MHLSSAFLGRGTPRLPGKSAKIEEECAPVPGSFWSSGPFSSPRIGDIFRRQWVAAIVSHYLIAFQISPGWILCFQIMPEGSQNWVTLMGKISMPPGIPGVPIPGKPMTGALLPSKNYEQDDAYLRDHRTWVNMGWLFLTGEAIVDQHRRGHKSLLCKDCKGIMKHLWSSCTLFIISLPQGIFKGFFIGGAFEKRAF